MSYLTFLIQELVACRELVQDAKDTAARIRSNHSVVLHKQVNVESNSFLVTLLFNKQSKDNWEIFLTFKY